MIRRVNMEVAYSDLPDRLEAYLAEQGGATLRP